MIIRKSEPEHVRLALRVANIKMQKTGIEDNAIAQGPARF
jgi:hypothetical protein